MHAQSIAQSGIYLQIWANRELFIGKYHILMDIILSIPVSTKPVILDAHTPFSAYCFIKDRCLTVKDRLIWVDRYMDESLFYRFIRDIPTSVSIVIVTWPYFKTNSKKDK